MDIQTRKSLTRNLSPIGAWAFALGTSIGWGSLVVTANTYLAQAGPVGSVIGLVLGAIIMLVVCQNYAYMMSCYPDAGGVYSFCRECFGYDHGFLAAWFLMLTYLAMLWANATSLPLFARYFLGDIFRFGRMYELFGYGVYLGEALLSVAFILAAAFLCARSKNVAARLMIGMVLLFVVGIVLCFCGAAIHLTDNWSPAFVTGKAPLGQIVKIAVISPWAFIGFESISHSTEEFSFPQRQLRKTLFSQALPRKETLFYRVFRSNVCGKVRFFEVPQSRFFRVLAVSVAAATLLYVFVTLLSVTAYPPSMAVGWNIYVIWTI